jgi:hypothetical protein
MDAEKITKTHSNLEVAEELPPPSGGFLIGLLLELGSCPVCGLFRGGIEIRRLVQRTIVMVSHEGPFTDIGNAIHAGHGIRTIPEDIAEADDPVGIATLDISEDHFEGLEIAMDVTDDCGTHWGVSSRNGKRGCYVLGYRTVNVPHTTNPGTSPYNARTSNPLERGVPTCLIQSITISSSSEVGPEAMLEPFEHPNWA